MENNPHLMYNRLFQKFVTISVALFSLFLLVITVSAMKEYRFIGAGTTATNTISVSGEGEVFVVPDIATFSFLVIEEKKTAKKAQDSATKKINDALSFLRGDGIEDKDIKTTSYNVYPRYNYIPCTEFSCPVDNRELVGFEVRQSIEVKVRDIAKAGDLLVGIGDVGISQISGLAFTNEDEDILVRDARGLAILDAKAKAKELARDLGVRVVRIVGFSERGESPRYYDFKAVVYSEEADDSIAPEIPTGENKITSFVTITYEIR